MRWRDSVNLCATSCSSWHISWSEYRSDFSRYCRSVAPNLSGVVDSSEGDLESRCWTMVWRLVWMKSLHSVDVR